MHLVTKVGSLFSGKDAEPGCSGACDYKSAPNLLQGNRNAVQSSITSLSSGCNLIQLALYRSECRTSLVDASYIDDDVLTATKYTHFFCPFAASLYSYSLRTL